MAVSPKPPTPSAALQQAAAQAWQRHQGQGQLAVAYSGGADSTALLLAACSVRPGHVLALHVNHQLQPAAKHFEAHVRRQCQAWGVPLQVLGINAQPAPGQSPEDAARNGRYLALAQAASQAGACQVWLGQHADDQVESLLLALTRGAGVAGLAAMPEHMQRHGCTFVRPLLQWPGAALRDEVQRAGAPFVDDPTNRDTQRTRNRLRHQVVPPLLQAFPQARETLARSARHAAHAHQLLGELAAMDLQQTGNPPAIAALQALGTARQANVLRHWLLVYHEARASTAQLGALQQQLQACRTAGHGISLKVGHGMVQRQGSHLHFEPLL